jgi:hypothetical protein
MRHLSVENPIAVDSVLSHQGTSILAEIMKNLDYFSVFQNLLERMGPSLGLHERIYFKQIEDVAKFAYSHLNQPKIELDKYLKQNL